MRDIETREDIQQLIDTFYEKVFKDELIGDFFTTIAKIEKGSHLEKMYDFWESILFDAGLYKGNTFRVHESLNGLKKIDSTHFDRWLTLFDENLALQFEGPKATLAKERAHLIGITMKVKLEAKSNKNSIL